MDKNRKNEFYQITKKEFKFVVSRGDTVVFSTQCEDLTQCGTALIAKHSNGLHSLYLPVRTHYEQWDFTKGFICIFENIREYFHYQKTKPYFNDGMLLLKLETGDSVGYWTAIYLDFFEYFLTQERARTRCASLFKIPYTGASEGSFLKNFDYLPLDTHFITIDNEIYLVDNLGGSFYSESAHMLVQALKNVKIEPLPFKRYFKVTSNEGESIYTTLCENKGCRQDFGPFFKIEKVNFEYTSFRAKEPVCYLARNEHDEILGMFGQNISSNDDTSYKILFSSPVKTATPVEIINDTLVGWKLSYVNGDEKILICSNPTIFLDLYNYI